MRFYSQSHPFTCGVDLHGRSMYLCVLGPDGEKVLHRNMPTRPEAFLETMAPYRGDLVIGCECVFCWYWLADLCQDKGIPFGLGHSYSRLVAPRSESSGKLGASRGRKQGNVHLKFAFSEAAVHILRANPRAQKLHQRLVRRHGKAKALSILAHKIGRAVFYMQKRKVPFDAERFYQGA